jgi:DNA-binding response OmpR family regulator
MAQRVLIVDDDMDTVEMLGIWFEAPNFEFHSAGSVKTAKALINANVFDLVLLDNWLPDGNGVEICREIRSRYSNLPVIFYSGAGYPEDIAQALEAGCCAYLVKPCSIEELDRVVKLVAGVRLLERDDNRLSH